MRLMLLSLLLLLIIIIDATEARQYILVSKVQLNFNDAQAFCVNTYGTNLATISDANDHAALVTLMRGLGSDPNKKAWIGLNDIASEAGTDRNGPWAFTSGGAYTFRDAWQPGEPTNAGGNEDCVVMESNSGTYDDKPCSNLNSFFCDDAINPRYIPYVNERRNFEDADQFCIANHGKRLATIRNQVEQDLLLGLIGDLGLNQTGTWIGLNDRTVEAGTNPNGPWQWTSGQTFSFQNFAPGEPSAIFETTDEDCVEIEGITRAAFTNLTPGGWNDDGCTRLMSFVCDNNLNALSITKSPTTSAPTTKAPTTSAPTTKAPTTSAPTTKTPTTSTPITSSPVTISSPSTKDDGENNSNIIIIGAAVGAVLFFAGIAAIVVIRRRRRLNSDGKTLSQEFDAASSLGATPFSKSEKYLNQLQPTHYFHQSRNTFKRSFRFFGGPRRGSASTLSTVPTVPTAMVVSPPPPGLGYTQRGQGFVVAPPPLNFEV